MITLTWGQIRNPVFNQIITRLMTSKMKSFKTARKLLDIQRFVRRELRKSEEMWAKVTADYLEPVPDQPQFLQMKSGFTEQEKIEAGNVVEDFNKTVVKLHKPQLTEAELEGVELSGHELDLLDGLVEGCEHESEDKLSQETNAHV